MNYNYVMGHAITESNDAAMHQVLSGVGVSVPQL